MEKSFDYCSLIFVGISASGKGTQIRKINQYIKEKGKAKKLKLFEAGKELKLIPGMTDYVSKGGLVDDSIMNPIFDSFMDTLRYKEIALFDGYPRKLSQARHFDEIISTRRKRMWPIIVFYLKLSDEQAVSRMLKRSEVENRSDDNIFAIRKRLEWFKKDTLPVIDFFRNGLDYLVFEIDAEKSIDEIGDEILEQVSKYY